MRTRCAIALLLGTLGMLGCGVSRGLDDPEGTSEAGGDEVGSTSAPAPSDLGEAEGPPVPSCADEDGDGVDAPTDNAPRHVNPDQADADADGFGDVVDACPLLPSDANTEDSDKDGVGNDCDRCRRQLDDYNEHALAASVPFYLRVRNLPAQRDTDRDGIGDACDDCPAVPDCEGYGPDHPYAAGDPLADDDPSVCQTDADADMIGDACVGLTLPGAAGPVGFAPTDDFDQDGLSNLDDACPRLVVEAVACSVDADCGPDRRCTLGPDDVGVCNHRDRDGDHVGDECDTCPGQPNLEQILDGGMQEDDEDGDFVGGACEIVELCRIRKNPRPLAFMAVSVAGQCCVATYPGDGVYAVDEHGDWVCEGLCDPDGLPITRDCEHEPASPEQRVPDGVACRRVPDALLEVPGVFAPPAGCEQALLDAGKQPDGSDNARLGLEDVGGDLDALWAQLCFLPLWDQDFDAVPDACDLCEFAFDPNNEESDAWGSKLPAPIGKYCNGEYACE